MTAGLVLAAALLQAPREPPAPAHPGVQIIAGAREASPRRRIEPGRAGQVAPRMDVLPAVP